MFTGKRKEEEPWYELVPDGPILSHKELLEQSSSIPEYAIRNDDFHEKLHSILDELASNKNPSQVKAKSARIPPSLLCCLT